MLYEGPSGTWVAGQQVNMERYICFTRAGRAAETARKLPDLAVRGAVSKRRHRNAGPVLEAGDNKMNHSCPLSREGLTGKWPDRMAAHRLSNNITV